MKIILPHFQHFTIYFTLLFAIVKCNPVFRITILKKKNMTNLQSTPIEFRFKNERHLLLKDSKDYFSIDDSDEIIYDYQIDMYLRECIYKNISLVVLSRTCLTSMVAITIESITRKEVVFIANENDKYTQSIEEFEELLLNAVKDGIKIYIYLNSNETK